jgi:hypothetical protein
MRGSMAHLQISRTDPGRSEVPTAVRMVPVGRRVGLGRAPVTPDKARLAA